MLLRPTSCLCISYVKLKRFKEFRVKQQDMHDLYRLCKPKFTLIFAKNELKITKKKMLKGNKANHIFISLI